MSDRWRWVPNALTLLRILMVAPFAWALIGERYPGALMIFFVAAATDGLDGFLARFYGWRTRLGAIADPLADKLLLTTAWFCFSLTGLVPWWLFVLVLARDLAIVVGGLLFHRFIGQFDVQPSILGKLNTLIQVAGAVLVMMLQAGVVLPGGAMSVIIAMIAVSACVSGGHYIWVWGLRAWRGRAG
ncbi:CDP-alcohol phosphatidyltransferase family protein [uncultured Marinobacter sp.]|mgnify:CR=1 FL=1|uniref:CDP-alcohol phosphatidyltransferase family protein n=1 Tax=uncultured Marinobacter sp. TaxID=187379 RepID=UPI0030D7AB2A